MKKQETLSNTWHLLNKGVLACCLVTLTACTPEIREHYEQDLFAVKTYPYEETFREAFGLEPKNPPLSEQEIYAIVNGCNQYLSNAREQTYNGVEDSYVYIECPKMAPPAQLPQRMEGR